MLLGPDGTELDISSNGHPLRSAQCGVRTEMIRRIHSLGRAVNQINQSI